MTINPWPPPSRAEVSKEFPGVQQEIARLSALPEIRSTFAWFRTQEPQFAHWQLEMARIAAPPFGEAARGTWLKERFEELDLEDVHVDDVGNVIGLRHGIGKRCVTVSAHMDTVFSRRYAA